MSHSAERILAKIMPFIGMGVFIVLFVIGLVVFSYLIVIGAMIGLILFLVALIRSKFKQNKPHRVHQKNSHHGRTIEHENHQ